MVPGRGLLQRASVGGGIALRYRLPLLTALDRVNNDPGPEPNDHDASDHLPRDQHTSALGRGCNVAKPDRREYGDGEVQGVGTRERLTEIGRRNLPNNEVRPGKQQQKQRSARRKRSDRAQRWKCCPDDRADLKGDQSDKSKESDYQHPNRHTYRSVIQGQQVVNRNERDRGSQCAKKSHQDPAEAASGLTRGFRTPARAFSHGQRLAGEMGEFCGCGLDTRKRAYRIGGQHGHDRDRSALP
jgi:hypothetical protein